MRSTFLSVNQSTFKRRLAGGFPNSLSYLNFDAVFCVSHAGSERQAGWIVRFRAVKNWPVMVLRPSRVQAEPLDCAMAAVLPPNARNQMTPVNSDNCSALFIVELSCLFIESEVYGVDRTSFFGV